MQPVMVPKTKNIDMIRHVLLGSVYPKRHHSSKESISQSNHDSSAISKPKSSGISEVYFRANNPCEANLQQNDRPDGVEGMHTSSASDDHCGYGGSKTNAIIPIPSHSLTGSVIKPNEVNSSRLSRVSSASTTGGNQPKQHLISTAAQKNKDIISVGTAAGLNAEQSTDTFWTAGSNRQFHDENFEGGVAKPYGPTNIEHTSHPGQVLGLTNHPPPGTFPPVECRGSEVSAVDSSRVNSAYATIGDAQNQFSHFGNGRVPVLPACPLYPQVPVFRSYSLVPLLPPMAMGATLHPLASSDIDAHRQGVGTFVPSPAQLTMTTQQSSTAANISNVVSKEYCARNLRPAPLPRNPVDDEWEKSTLLEKEIAWLVEETDVIMPSRRNDVASQNKPLLPLLLDYAWKHGSLQLREIILERFPSKISSLVTKLNNEGIPGRGTSDYFAGGSGGLQLGLIDGQELLLLRYGNKTNLSRKILNLLRKEARHALRLGFRRSESIERELNIIQGLRWRDAVEEVGDPSADKYWTAKPKPSRHRRKRLKNEALFRRALGQDCGRNRDRDSSHSLLDRELETIASRVPSELTPLEDEVAWLVEESLILLPDDMCNDNNKQTESFMTAGLVTNSADIKWDYVEEHASEPLKEHFKRKGGIKRRPLQRIIRYTNTATRCEFQKRRDQIASLLLLHGYRRNETKTSLPSHELLIQTGLDKVWAVRLMRRKQNKASKDVVSSKDLRSACNARICEKEPLAKSPQRPKEKRRRGRTPKASLKKSQPPEIRPAVTQKCHTTASLAKPQPPGPISRLPGIQEDHATAYFEKSQPSASEVRPAFTQNDHAAAALLDEPKPPESAARVPVAKKNHKCHTTASLKKLQLPEPFARIIENKQEILRKSSNKKCEHLPFSEHNPTNHKRRKKSSPYRGVSMKGPSTYHARVTQYPMGCYKFGADAALAYDIGIKRVKGPAWKFVNFASRQDYERAVRVEMEKAGSSANAAESFQAVLAKAEVYMSKHFPEKVLRSEYHDKEERALLEKSQPPAPEARLAVTQHDHAAAALLEKPKPQKPAVKVAVAKSKPIAAAASKKSQAPDPGFRPSYTQKAAAQSGKLAITQKAQPPAPEARLAVTQHDHAAAALLEKPKPQEPAVRVAVTKSKPIAAAASKGSQAPDPGVKPSNIQKAAAQSGKLAVTQKAQPPAPEARLAITQHDHAAAALLEKPKPQEPAVRVAVAKSKPIAAAASKGSQAPDPGVRPSNIQKAAAQSSKLAATQKAQSSILAPGEEELAWLREEYEFETGINRYDWEYIEQNSSLPLLIQLAERRCAPSSVSVAGASRLRAMVRLDDPRVEEAFDAKRRDVRHAITVLGHRRDRSRHLPDVPAAPASFGRPAVRGNGANVMDVEYACDVVGTGGVENEIICIDDDSDDDASREGASEKSRTPRDDNDRNGSGASSTGKKERSNNIPRRDAPAKESYLCEIICIDDNSDDEANHEDASEKSRTPQDYNDRNGSGGSSTGKKERSNAIHPQNAPAEGSPLCDEGEASGKESDGANTEEKTTQASLSKCHSFESCSEQSEDKVSDNSYDDESEEEVEEDDDDEEYEVSSDEESDDDDS